MFFTSLFAPIHATGGMYFGCGLGLNTTKFKHNTFLDSDKNVHLTDRSKNTNVFFQFELGYRFLMKKHFFFDLGAHIGYNKSTNSNITRSDQMGKNEIKTLDAALNNPPMDASWKINGDFENRQNFGLKARIGGYITQRFGSYIITGLDIVRTTFNYSGSTTLSSQPPLPYLDIQDKLSKTRALPYLGIGGEYHLFAKSKIKLFFEAHYVFYTNPNFGFNPSLDRTKDSHIRLQNDANTTIAQDLNNAKIRKIRILTGFRIFL